MKLFIYVTDASVVLELGTAVLRLGGRLRDAAVTMLASIKVQTRTNAVALWRVWKQEAHAVIQQPAVSQSGNAHK